MLVGALCRARKCCEHTRHLQLPPVEIINLIFAGRSLNHARHTIFHFPPTRCRGERRDYFLLSHINGKNTRRRLKRFYLYAGPPYVFMNDYVQYLAVKAIPNGVSIRRGWRVLLTFGLQCETMGRSIRIKYEPYFILIKKKDRCDAPHDACIIHRIKIPKTSCIQFAFSVNRLFVTANRRNDWYRAREHIGNCYLISGILSNHSCICYTFPVSGLFRRLRLVRVILRTCPTPPRTRHLAAVVLFAHIERSRLRDDRRWNLCKDQERASDSRGRKCIAIRKRRGERWRCA